MPITTAFLLASIAAIMIFKGQPFKERIETFSRGAGNHNIMLMIWIFVMAGAFASTAKAMGAIDATVALVMSVLPAGWLLPGLFLASCLISMSIGTSVGTIVALTPIAVGVAPADSVPLYVAAAVGGAFFGDNLSFISDTTIMATRTQGIEMREKFLANIWFALPAAILTLIIYIIIGEAPPQPSPQGDGVFPLEGGLRGAWLSLPYFAVLLTALCGMNVMKSLTLGLLLAAGIGITTGNLDFPAFFQSIADGITGMSDLILVTMLAGGIMATLTPVLSIKGEGVFSLHLHTNKQDISKEMGTTKSNGNKKSPSPFRERAGARVAQLLLGALVMGVDCVTANNTVAILTVGDFARRIGERYHISPRRVASILDTFSCIAQGLIPWGAQLLMAAGLASLSPTAIVPLLYYPFILSLTTITGILITQGGLSQNPTKVFHKTT